MNNHESSQRPKSSEHIVSRRNVILAAIGGIGAVGAAAIPAGVYGVPYAKRELAERKTNEALQLYYGEVGQIANALLDEMDVNGADGDPNASPETAHYEYDATTNQLILSSADYETADFSGAAERVIVTYDQLSGIDEYPSLEEVKIAVELTRPTKLGILDNSESYGGTLEEITVEGERIYSGHSYGDDGFRGTSHPINGKDDIEYILNHARELVDMGGEE